MTTYYARATYTYDGGDKIFSVTFSYIDESYVHVYVNSTETTNFTFNSDSQIEISDDMEEGDIVLIKRETPIDERLVTFSNRTILDKDTQNLAFEQVFDAVQEYIDAYGVLSVDTETVLSLILEQTDDIDVDLESLTSIAEEVAAQVEVAQTAAQEAEAAAEEAVATLEGIEEELENKASVDLDNLSSAGIEVLQQYGGSSSSGTTVTLTWWEDD